MEDLVKNMREYLRHYQIYEVIQGMYDKHELELRERRLTNNGLLVLDKVTEAHLEEAGVSKREFEQMKVLLGVDRELFRPSEYGAFSPHSMLVDISKYDGVKIPKEAKEILYRPPRVKQLYDQYWRLAKVCEGKEKVENDREILTDYRARYPRKPAEEVALIDNLIKRLGDLIEEDRRELASQSSSTSNQLRIELAEGDQDESIFYEGAGAKALKDWRKMSEAERAALKKGDEVDAVNTTDLEAEDSDGLNEISYDFFVNNRINLARAFLGMDGGYSVRKLKKFYLQDQKAKKDQKQAEEEQRRTRQTPEGTEEAAAEAKPEDAAAEEQLPYSDESDIDAALDNMDDETFEKLIEEANAAEFQTEEEAQAFFDKKMKEFTRIKNKKVVVKEDPREKTDPYWAMMKEDKKISSRFADTWDLDDEDKQAYLDMVEKNIARYPIGFRHYENFENYKAFKEDATIHEYHEESKSDG